MVIMPARVRVLQLSLSRSLEKSHRTEFNTIALHIYLTTSMSRRIDPIFTRAFVSNRTSLVFTSPSTSAQYHAIDRRINNRCSNRQSSCTSSNNPKTRTGTLGRIYTIFHRRQLSTCSLSFDFQSRQIDRRERKNELRENR